MPAFVALLRGINVGKAKRVAMADLRRILQDLGCTDVATLLNSGNAVFRRAKAPPRQIADEIADAIVTQLDVTAAVVVKSSAEFAAVIGENPFARQAADPSLLLVAFTQEPKTLAALSSLAPLATPPDRFAVGRHGAYLLCPAGSLESRVGAALLGKPGASATTRNWATCLKIHALLKETDA